MTTSTGESRAEQSARGNIPEDTFAARLRLVRMHLGDITIEDAADRCGLNYGSWSNWERGVMPRDRVEIARVISEALGIDLNWLVYGGPLAQPAPRATLRRAAREMFQESARRHTRPNGSLVTLAETVVAPHPVDVRSGVGHQRHRRTGRTGRSLQRAISHSPAVV